MSKNNPAYNDTELETVNDNKNNGGILSGFLSFFNGKPTEQTKNIIKAFKMVHKEVSSSFLDFVKKHKINFEYVDEDGNTLLHKLARFDYKETSHIIDYILRQPNKKSFINKQNKKGETPVFIAVLNKNDKLANILVENGADKNIETYDNDKIFTETETVASDTKSVNDYIKKDNNMNYSTSISDTSATNNSIFQRRNRNDTSTESVLDNMYETIKNKTGVTSNNNNKTGVTSDNDTDAIIKQLLNKRGPSIQNVGGKPSYTDSDDTEAIIRKIQNVGGKPSYTDSDDTNTASILNTLYNNARNRDTDEVARNVFKEYKGGDFFDNLSESINNLANNVGTQIKNSKLDFEKAANNYNTTTANKVVDERREEVRKNSEEIKDLLRRIENSPVPISANISVDEYINKTFENDKNKAHYMRILNENPEIKESLVEVGILEIKKCCSVYIKLFDALDEMPLGANIEKFINNVKNTIRNAIIDIKKKKNEFMQGGAKKIKGTRKIAKADKRRSMNSVAQKASRAIARQRNDTHANVLKTIMEIMSVDEDTARNYKAGLWSDLKKKFGEKWDTMSQLTKATELEKVATEKILKKVDLAKAAKIRQQNAASSAERRSAKGGYSETSDESSYDEDSAASDIVGSSDSDDDEDSYDVTDSNDDEDSYDEDSYEEDD